MIIYGSLTVIVMSIKLFVKPFYGRMRVVFLFFHADDASWISEELVAKRALFPHVHLFFRTKKITLFITVSHHPLQIPQLSPHLRQLSPRGDPHGTERAWDVVSRTTKSHGVAKGGVDAVIILPLLRSKKQQLVETLLVPGGSSDDIWRFPEIGIIWDYIGDNDG